MAMLSSLCHLAAVLPLPPADVQAVQPDSATAVQPDEATIDYLNSLLQASFDYPVCTFEPLFRPGGQLCHDPSKKANQGGFPDYYEFYDRQCRVPVSHTDDTVFFSEMEHDNLWMYLLDSNPTPSTLMYIPGRTIIFDDYAHALRHVSSDRNLTQAEGTRLIATSKAEVTSKK